MIEIETLCSILKAYPSGYRAAFDFNAENIAMGDVLVKCREIESSEPSMGRVIETITKLDDIISNYKKQINELNESINQEKSRASSYDNEVARTLDLVRERDLLGLLFSTVILCKKMNVDVIERHYEEYSLVQQKRREFLASIPTEAEELEQHLIALHDKKVINDELIAVILSSPEHKGVMQEVYGEYATSQSVLHALQTVSHKAMNSPEFLL